MSERRIGPVLSLLRQGLTVGVEYGAHSLEALLWVAETVENGVYRPGSLVRHDAGLAFILDNPPLRTGAFSSARLSVEGAPLAPEEVRCRVGPGGPWRRFDSISAATPLELRPGVPTEFETTATRGSAPGPITVRLELISLAIPPRVWFEFTDRARPEER